MVIFHIYDILKSNASNSYLVNCNSDTKYGHLNHFMKDYDKSNTHMGTQTQSDRTPPPAHYVLHTQNHPTIISLL
jgi:ribosomal protein S2